MMEGIRKNGTFAFWLLQIAAVSCLLSRHRSPSSEGGECRPASSSIKQSISPPLSPLPSPFLSLCYPLRWEGGNFLVRKSAEPSTLGCDPFGVFIYERRPKNLVIFFTLFINVQLTQLISTIVTFHCGRPMSMSLRGKGGFAGGIPLIRRV